MTKKRRTIDSKYDLLVTKSCIRDRNKIRDVSWLSGIFTIINYLRSLTNIIERFVRVNIIYRVNVDLKVDSTISTRVSLRSQ